MFLHTVLYWSSNWVNFVSKLKISRLFLYPCRQPAMVQNSCIIQYKYYYRLLRTRYNATKLVNDSLYWDALLTVFLIIDILLIFVFTCSVHYEHLLNTKHIC